MIAAFRAATAAALALAVAVSASPALARPSDHDPAPARVIVLHAPHAAAAAERAVDTAGGRVERRLEIVDGFVATVPAAGLASVGAANGVRSVTADRALRLTAADGADADGADADAGVRMDLVRAAVGATDTADGSGVDVALIDSGVTPVPGLADSAVVDGPDFSSDARDPAFAHRDAFGHGTHLAGIIAGRDPSIGFSGIAPGARLVSVKVAARDGSTTLSRLLAGLDWTVRNQRRGGLDIRIINLAFGADPHSSYRTDPLAAAVEAAWQRGIVVVTAAGNGGPQAPSLDSPARDPYVIAVGAQDTLDTPSIADDLIAEFSSRGTPARSPDVVAPGVGIVSLRVPEGVLDQEYPQARIGERGFRGSGTSQAAAVVTGAVARLLQARRELGPDAVKAVLRASAQRLHGAEETLQGRGVVNLAAARTAPVVGATQSWPRAIAGVWRARGVLGAELAVERPSASRWTASRWTASRWTASRWTASRWTASRWTASRWTASRWTASRWTTADWGGPGQ